MMSQASVMTKDHQFHEIFISKDGNFDIIKALKSLPFALRFTNSNNNGFVMFDNTGGVSSKAIEYPIYVHRQGDTSKLYLSIQDMGASGKLAGSIFLESDDSFALANSFVEHYLTNIINDEVYEVEIPSLEIRIQGLVNKKTFVSSIIPQIAEVLTKELGEYYGLSFKNV